MGKDSLLKRGQISQGIDSSYWLDWSWFHHLRVVDGEFQGCAYRTREIRRERGLIYVRVKSLRVVNHDRHRRLMLRSLYGGWYEKVDRALLAYLSWGVMQQSIFLRAQSALRSPYQEGYSRALSQALFFMIQEVIAWGYYVIMLQRWGERVLLVLGHGWEQNQSHDSFSYSVWYRVFLLVL